jgi:hypothetical protein
LLSGELLLHVDFISSPHCYALNDIGEDHALTFQWRGIEHLRPFKVFFDLKSLGGQNFFCRLVLNKNTWDGSLCSSYTTRIFRPLARLMPVKRLICPSESPDFCMKTHENSGDGEP